MLSLPKSTSVSFAHATCHCGWRTISHVDPVVAHIVRTQKAFTQDGDWEYGEPVVSVQLTVNSRPASASAALVSVSAVPISRVTLNCSLLCWDFYGRGPWLQVQHLNPETQNQL